MKKLRHPDFPVRVPIHEDYGRTDALRYVR